MDIKQLLDKLRPSSPLVTVKVQETWTVRVENGKTIAERRIQCIHDHQLGNSIMKK
jgi:hypothetical protein